MSNLIKVLSDVQAKRKQLSEEVKGVLADGIREFMKEHADVKCITWTQYTPYFADGDPCVFGVNDFYVSLTSTDVSEAYDDENFHTVYNYNGCKIPEGFSNQLWADLAEFTKVLSNSGDDLQAAFGDHVQVIVIQTGVDVEEYEHD